jgi:hypothetical protein
MQDAALGSETVLLPKPLDMDERRLPQAIDGMLDRRDGDEVAVHRTLPSFPLLVARFNQIEG